MMTFVRRVWKSIITGRRSMSTPARLQNSITHYLTQMDSLREQFVSEQFPLTPEGWLLKYGEFFGPNIKRPKGLHLMKLKNCYQNSSDTLIHHELDCDEWFYCEGYACSKTLGIPLEHAWLANREGQVIDRTWRYKPGEGVYFGVPFKFDYMTDTIFSHGYYGMLSNGVRFNTDLFNASPEEFRAWSQDDESVAA